jgi:predicted transcriptional regulator
MSTKFTVVPASTTVQEFRKIASEQSSIPNFIVEDRHNVAGFVSSELLNKPPDKDADASTRISDIAAKDYIIAGENDMLLDVISKMRNTNASITIVTNRWISSDIRKVKGVLTRQQIADALVEAAELFVE